MSYKPKGPQAPINPRDVRWVGEYSDFIERLPKPRKGLPFQKPKRKKK